MSEEFCQDPEHKKGHCDTCGKPLEFEDDGVPKQKSVIQRLIRLGFSLPLLVVLTTMELSVISTFGDKTMFTLAVLPLSMASSSTPIQPNQFLQFEAVKFLFIIVIGRIWLDNFNTFGINAVKLVIRFVNFTESKLLKTNQRLGKTGTLEQQ